MNIFWQVLELMIPQMIQASLPTKECNQGLGQTTATTWDRDSREK